MLDDHTEKMLKVANTLTADDLDFLRASAPEELQTPELPTPSESTVEKKPAVSTATSPPPRPVDPSRGERERQRTRASKISTQCVGTARAKHDWWPVGTELVGQMSGERFTAEVVENTQVKSGRSIRLTSGAAQGKVCITPTRAALEATEAFRQAHGLGRAGGVTNGWTFWTVA